MDYRFPTPATKTPTQLKFRMPVATASDILSVTRSAETAQMAVAAAAGVLRARRYSVPFDIVREVVSLLESKGFDYASSEHKRTVLESLR